MISILIATAVALTVTLLGTPLFIRWLRGKGYGQLIREDGPTSHFVKRGTPTMGGAVIILGVLLGYFTAHLIAGPRASVDPSFTASGLLVLFLMTGLGIVGLLDDGIKIFKQRSLGLRARAKFIGQAAVTIAFAVLSIQFADDRGLTPASTAVSVVRDTVLDLGPILFVLWAYLLVSGFSNAVNLTDGLDGLAGGAAIACFGAYSVITFWQFRNSCPQATEGLCYEVRDPFDLALVSSALVGAVAGFLWWNASPARIFMGDTGSLALGGALAGMAILSRTELLLVVIAGLYVIITASVMIQVGYFKISGGKRVFKMAPLQHHFELSGWNEVTIVIRFWIVAGLFAAFGVGLFYAEYLGGSAL